MFSFPFNFSKWHHFLTVAEQAFLFCNQPRFPCSYFYNDTHSYFTTWPHVLSPFFSILISIEHFLRYVTNDIYFLSKFPFRWIFSLLRFPFNGKIFRVLIHFKHLQCCFFFIPYSTFLITLIFRAPPPEIIIVLLIWP